MYIIALWTEWIYGDRRAYGSHTKATLHVIALQLLYMATLPLGIAVLGVKMEPKLDEDAS
eukprot:scaffold17477_cov93-Cylindrotheca_fusiformis.AAC.1